MKGIYKITSPSGRVYIGQSVNIENRFKYYFRKDCKAQTRLHASFLKYGVGNHTFAVLQECDESELNNLERYWQDFYDAIGERGLNCVLTFTESKSGKLSEEIKNKIRKSNTGKVFSETHIANLIKSSLGRKLSKETKLKISNAGLKRVQSKSTRDKIGAIHKGKILTEDQKNKILRSKKVKCNISGTVYDSVKEAALKNGISKSGLSDQLRGVYRNKTNLVYL